MVSDAICFGIPALASIDVAKATARSPALQADNTGAMKTTYHDSGFLPTEYALTWIYGLNPDYLP